MVHFSENAFTKESGIQSKSFDSLVEQKFQMDYGPQGLGHPCNDEKEEIIIPGDNHCLCFDKTLNSFSQFSPSDLSYHMWISNAAKTVFNQLLLHTLYVTPLISTLQYLLE